MNWINTIIIKIIMPLTAMIIYVLQCVTEMWMLSRVILIGVLVIAFMLQYDTANVLPEIVIRLFMLPVE